MSTGIRRLSMAAVMAVALATSATRGLQDQADAARARIEIGAQLEELGTTLKAAAMSGTLTDKEAWEIYDRVIRAAKTAYVRDFGDGQSKPEAAPSPKDNVIRLTARRPRELRLLLQPEFLRRDLRLLRDELELDHDQMTIVEVLFDDYAMAYDLASAPLKAGLGQYRSATMSTYIAFSLEDAGVKLDAAMANARQVDREEAVARMTETLERIDHEKAEGLASASEEDRRQYEAWKRSMIAASSQLDDRLAAIRDRTRAQLDEMRRADATMTTEELVGMARQLHADRSQLRADLTKSLEMIATETQRGEENALFDAAMARIRVGQLLPQGRLGGESMNLWAAWMETVREQESRETLDESLESVEDLLGERAVGIAAKLDDRTEATIAREIAGLEFQSARDRIAAASGESIFEVDERRLAAVVRPYVEALHREVTASIATRDALRLLFVESSAYVFDLPGNKWHASAYREAALRSEFPVETRPRWTERAIAAALGLDEVGDEVMEDLLVLESDAATELHLLRARAIHARTRRDPKLARDFIASEFEDADIEFDEDVWREVEHAAFTALADRTEVRLRDILTPEQLDSLPVRPEERTWGAGRDKSKTRGESAGKSRGK
ncbi:MAG: hypothetical protein GY715_18810 [Planctomycetes bacterium]|nr:hypothetical protein [Planctomycetota bacterium]